MIRHVLLLRPAPETTLEAIDDCRKAITGLVGQVPGLLDCHWGENFARKERTDGCSHGFSMDFPDRASLEAYAPHPAHLPAAKLVRAAFEKILVFDFELTAR